MFHAAHRCIYHGHVTYAQRRRREAAAFYPQHHQHPTTSTRADFAAYGDPPATDPSGCLGIVLVALVILAGPRYVDDRFSRASSVASSGTCKSVGVFRNNDLAGWWLRRRMWRQVEILPQQMLPQQLLAEASRPVAGADVVVIDAMDPRDTPLVLDVGAPRASSPAPPRHHERRGWSPPPG